jgi:hypothetical protein
MLRLEEPSVSRLTKLNAAAIASITNPALTSRRFFIYRLSPLVENIGQATAIAKEAFIYGCISLPLGLGQSSEDTGAGRWGRCDAHPVLVPNWDHDYGLCATLPMTLGAPAVYW